MDQKKISVLKDAAVSLIEFLSDVISLGLATKIMPYFVNVC